MAEPGVPIGAPEPGMTRPEAHEAVCRMTGGPPELLVNFVVVTAARMPDGLPGTGIGYVSPGDKAQVVYMLEMALADAQADLARDALIVGIVNGESPPLDVT